MLGRLQLAYDVWRHFGLRWTLFRIYYALGRKLGWLKRRFPTGGWRARPLAHWLRAGVPAEAAGYHTYRAAHQAPFFFAAGEPPELPAAWHADARAQGEAVLAGRPRFFYHRRADVGFPFDWFRNPFTDQRADATRHWCDRGDFEAGQGDIKVIWEQGRFGWVYALARAYAIDHDDRYAAGFWQLFESWRQANPPNMGPHWQCGQECSFRVMALCFGLYAFWNAPSSTPERVAALAQTLAEQGARIAGNIDYARSQQNNHAISEALGLYTIGTLLPELAAAADWRRRGKRLLEQLAQQQIFADGGYIQHSLNYHRLMLHDYAWVLRLAELSGDRFSISTQDQVRAAAEFVYQVQDDSGRVPNYGPNDGALILPLDGCDYLDYRPVVQTLVYLLTRTRRFEAGPWDEPLLWLFGASALEAATLPEPRRSLAAAQSGYYTLRAGEHWLLTRCHRYGTRPGHGDSLHVDLWWRGENVLRDAGTYQYNVAAEWKDYFSLSRAHNTVLVDGQTHMVRGPRFLWRNWIRAEVVAFRPESDGVQFHGRDLSFVKRCGVTHERQVERRGAHGWVVTDRFTGSGRHAVSGFWHLADGAVQALDAARTRWSLALPVGLVRLSITAEGGSEPEVVLSRGQEAPHVQGWESLYYAEKRPQPVLVWSLAGALPLTVRTEIVLGTASEA